MTKGSCLYCLFPEVDLFHALPAMYIVQYSDEFMDWTYNSDHSAFS